MTTISNMYRFERDPDFLSGSESKNRPSTDALTIVHQWRAMGNRREFNVTDDEFLFLEARLQYEADDTSAESQLDKLLVKYGLQHNII